MAMDPLDIEIVEIEEVESVEEGNFKKVMAFAAAAVALFGAIVVLLASQASVDSSKASRDAQLAASSGVGSEIRGDERNLVGFSTYLQIGEFRRRRVLALAEARRSAGTINETNALHEAAIWEEVATSLEPLTPLLADPKYAEEADPTFPFGFFVDNAVSSNVDDLRRQAKQELSNSYGGKSSRYGSVVTLLAVVLFLMSLSLTVDGRLRLAVLVPAAVIALACVVITIGASLGPVAAVPDQAIKDVAEGDRLMGRYDFSGAVGQYSKAIRLQPRYALAYGRRANALFFEGGDPVKGQQFIAYAPRKSIDAAVVDARKAVDLGADDVGSVNALGALLFHQQQYAKAVSIFRHAIDLNADNPLAWSNLGAAALAQGDYTTATDAYQHAVSTINARPFVGERRELYGTTISVLEILIEREPTRKDAATRVEDQLVAAELAKEVGDIAASQVKVSNLSIQFSTTGAYASFTAPGLSPDTPIGIVWYTRRNKDRPFQVESGMSKIEKAGEHSGNSLSYFSLPAECAAGGDYRVDVYLGGKRVATATANRKPTSLGRLQYAPFDGTLGVLVCQPEDWQRSRAAGEWLDIYDEGEKNLLTIEAVSVDFPNASPIQLQQQALLDATGNASAVAGATSFNVGGVPSLAVRDPSDPDTVFAATIVGNKEVRLATATGVKALELLATLTYYVPS
jgi:tetratricopeptide (TPR) repeat protein